MSGGRVEAFLPMECSALTRERMAHLNQDAAKWHLYELDEQHDALLKIDISDRGNLKTRLVHYADSVNVRDRFTAASTRILELMAEAEVAVLSAGEIAFRCHGLEFARARLAHEPGSFRSTTEIVFGLGAEEHVLDSSNLCDLTRLINSIGEVRHAEGPRDHTLWRMHPNAGWSHWLKKNVGAIDERLLPELPSFSGSRIFSCRPGHD